MLSGALGCRQPSAIQQPQAKQKHDLMTINVVFDKSRVDIRDRGQSARSVTNLMRHHQAPNDVMARRVSVVLLLAT